MNLGAGRVVYQDLTRISLAIETGEFAANPVINRAIDAALDRQRLARVRAAVAGRRAQPRRPHLRADRARGIARREAHLSARISRRPRYAAEKRRGVAGSAPMPSSRKLGVGQTASIVGRYFAMDRDQRWDRVERAYNLLVRGEAPFHAENAVAGARSRLPARRERRVRTTDGGACGGQRCRYAWSTATRSCS